MGTLQIIVTFISLFLTWLYFIFDHYFGSLSLLTDRRIKWIYICSSTILLNKAASWLGCFVLIQSAATMFVIFLRHSKLLLYFVKLSNFFQFTLLHSSKVWVYVFHMSLVLFISCLVLGICYFLYIGYQFFRRVIRVMSGHFEISQLVRFAVVFIPLI